MADQLPAASRTNVDPADPDVSDDDALAELRSLLLVPTESRLVELETRQHRFEADAVGRVLADAVELAPDAEHLADAIGPSVAEAIKRSARSDPSKLSEALYPVMGPAIRQAVAAALRGMVDTLNQMLDQSISPRAIGWRLEALRTGKSFAEVVLLHSLEYRVEQVFLIEKRTSTPLLHVTSDPADVRDGEVVSGMLSAIQDFVRDSFLDDQTDSVNTFRSRDKTVWIEDAPHAILAAVIRGNPPSELRATLRETLESVHASHGDALDRFDGDTAPFASARPELEACLQLAYRPPQPRPRWPALVALGLAAVLIVGWLALGWRHGRRLDRFIEALDAEPGLVVVARDERDGRLALTGLRDPLAAVPERLLADHGLAPDDVAMRWLEHRSAAPTLALERARQILAPPATVELELRGATLYASGEAPRQWLQRARTIAALLPGIEDLDTTDLLDSDRRATRRRVAAARAAIEQRSATFDAGSSDVAGRASGDLLAVALSLEQLARAARELGVPAIVEVTGHADSRGSSEDNLQLSRERAAAVIAALVAAGVEGVELRPRGAGSDEPLITDPNDRDRWMNRRVSFHVLQPPGTP